MNDNESTGVNAPVPQAVQNMQNAQLSSSSPIKKNRKGQYVGIQQKLKIINLYKVKIQQPYMKYKDLMLLISKESGFGYNTVCNTVRYYKKSNELKSPNNKKNRPKIQDRLNDFDKTIIRKKIHGFWYKNKIPTLTKLAQALNDDTDLPYMSKSSLRTVLKELGFEHTKKNRKSALTEREDVVVRRQKYIADIRRYRSEGRTIYFLGETWVSTDDTSSNLCMMDKTIKSNRDALVVVHIGSAEGFVEGGLLFFESKKNTEDHHDEMDDIFYDWFRGVLPKLKHNSIIVMDHSSYHSVEVDPFPTVAWRKDRMIEWLTSKGYVVEEPIVKHLIMDKLKEIRHLHHKYIIDEEASKSNKMVLRLPPHHSDLNPIELAWVAVKDHLKYNHTTYKLKAVLKLLIEAVRLVTPGMWADFVNHTLKEEKKLYNIDFIIEDMLDGEKSHLLKIAGDISSDFSD